jgi:hypothetical protein
MATIYYASIDDPHTMQDVAHAGTSSTSSDVIELRMGNGSNTVTRNAVEMALKIFQRWLFQGGLDSAGANLPSPTDTAGTSVE